MNDDLSRRDFLGHLALLASPLGALHLRAEELPRPQAAPSAEQALFSVRRFGARGDSLAKDTAAVQAAIDAAGREGGRVYFPPGRYLCGTLDLRSHVTIQLENGATLLASPERQDFAEIEKLEYTSYADQETTDFSFALLRGRKLEHVAIIGPGRINMARSKRGGPKPIALKLCHDVQVRDLTIENSPNYNLSFLGCDFVDILGVTIRNGYCDGIDPDCCRHVRIANCYIESWDDAIVPKASFALGYKRSTEHVTVTNCVLTTACTALKLGTESCGDFKGIVFSNCSIFSSPDVWPEHPVTAGVAVDLVDGGAVEGVAVSNLVMRDVQVPLFLRLANRGRAPGSPKPDHLRAVSFSDIVATGATLTSAITGIPGYPVRGVSLRNVRITAQGGAPAAAAAIAVPELESKYPDGSMFGVLPGYGLYCRHAADLILDEIYLSVDRADERPAMILDDIAGVDLRTLLAAPPAGTAETLRLSNVSDAFVQGCRASAQTTTWARVTGAKTQQVSFAANDLRHAQTPVKLDEDVPRGAVEL